MSCIRPPSWIWYLHVEDWDEEIFARGVGMKWKKWARGGEGNGKENTPPLHQTSTS